MSSVKPADYLGNLSMFGIKPGLEATQELMRRAGNPERELSFLHIAGTNGKGSTGALLESALREAGFTTGFYSSPHLIDIRERFRVNGLAVSEQDYLAYSAELAEAARTATGNDFRFTYFEFTTVLAALIFARAGVDIVIWETGMGGRLDSTNVVKPLASIITNIALDHQAYLGDTIEKIAGEKAGIIKPGIPVFTGVMPEAAHRVIAARAEELGCPLYGPAPEIATPVRYRIEGGSAAQEFEFDGRRITLPLLGAMQRKNFRLAAQVLDTLGKRLGIDPDRAFRGIAKCRWPARCQRLGERLIVDGGHNPDGLFALKEALAEVYPDEKFTVVFAGFRDKDVEQSLRLIAPVAEEFVFVPLHESDRPSYGGDALGELAERIGLHNWRSAANAKEAVDSALAQGSGKVLCAGSLYLAGEVLTAFADRSSVLDLV